MGVSLVLKCRQYSPEKITENMECEIMHVVVEEARDSYRHALPSSVPLIAVMGALAPKPIVTGLEKGECPTRNSLAYEPPCRIPPP